MTEPLRIGMLGYRFMGRAHANALARLPMFFPDAPDTELAVLIGRDEDALTDAAGRLGFTATSTDWQSAIDDVDVLYNLGPNYLHPEPSIAALDAGVHVFCEKPMAHTLEAAQEMRDTAVGADAIAGIAFNYRFVPAIHYAKSLIQDGTIGQIRHIRARYLQDWLVDPTEPWSWRNDAELAGSGALGDLGSHMVDLVRFLVHERAGGISAVSGHLQTFVDERPVPDGSESRPVTVDDAFTAQARFENDAIGTFEASRVATGSKNDLTIEIEGTDGGLRFALERLNELDVLTDGNRGYETVLATDETDPYIDRWWPPGHVIGWEHTFVHENYEFLSAIAANGQHDPSFDDGYRAQVMLDAIERSDEEDGWISID